MALRSKKAAAQPILPSECPSHELYRNADGPAWPNDPNIGLQPEDEVKLRTLKKALAEGQKTQFPAFVGKRLLQRVVEAYKQLPQSYKNKLWRTAADGLTATRYDNLLAPDTDFLKPEMQPMWDGMDCTAICPDNRSDNRLCPWRDDCKTFYDIRKPRWDRQHNISRACYNYWNLEEARRRGDVALERRRGTLAAKKEALRKRMLEEQKLSAMMFDPTEFPNEDNDVENIKQGFPLKKGGPPRESLDPMIAQFHALSQSNRFTLLDFQCAIADYFHDGMPGFRISSTKDPKISGIRVLDLNMIRIGKEGHQAFMYRFLSHVLHTIHTQPTARLSLIREQLLALGGKPIFRLPSGTPGDALNIWRNSLKLHGTRIEDSLIPHLHLPPDDSLPDIYHTSLSALKGKNPIHSYDAYLQSGKRRMTVHINKTGEIDLLTTLEAQRIVTFLLFVLFGPSYNAQHVTHPAQFTFDAHKGHTNRLLAKSNLPDVLRLVTPYNVADSAMTEKFKDVDPDDEDLAAEIEEEEDRGMSAADLAMKNKIKEDAKIEEDDEEAEDDAHTAAQKGEGRFIYTFNKDPAARSVAVSDTNMIFDNNWLIYYKNNGFTKSYPYRFSMNLVDAGLHTYITDKKIKNINPSAYTVEAPFSTEITRGPSLNYLMMGLMRGSTSDVFPKKREQPFNKTDELYNALCNLYPISNDNDVKRLLPIYTIPASSHSLPLFQHIAKAPLFAYHMLYDLQHHISALPSRIKWAGDREQYMAIQDVPNSVFVTLDTTGYYCALANRVPSLLERKKSIKLVGAVLNQAMKADIALRAAQTPQEAADPTPTKKGAKSNIARKGSKSALAGQTAQPTSDVKGAQPKLARKGPQSKPAEIDKQSKRAAYVIAQTPALKASASTKKSTGKGYMGGNYTRKNVTQSIPQSMPGREYFFLNWLYSLTMSVNAAFYGHHAEHAYVLLQDLQRDLSYPLLFPALQEQLIHAVSLIPNVPKDLMDAVTNLTAETYDIVAPECLSRLEKLYTSPHLSIFSQPVHKKTLLGYLGEMKEKLSRRLPNDSTANMLHILLAQDITQDQEKACLALSLLFERLHGRIQNGTSYLGQILGITGGPELECVDDQEAWEYLTDVLTEDMAWITDLSQQTVMPTKASIQMEATAPAEMPTVMPTETPAMMPSNPKMIRYSAKKHNVVRGPVYDKLKKDLRQLRSNRVRAMPMPTMQLAAAVAGGSLRKTRHATQHATRRQAKTRHATRRAKKGSRRRRND